MKEPRKYDRVNAWGARILYGINRGLSPEEIEPWPAILFEQLTETDFIARDDDGDESCRVEFVDGDGHASITFPDGDSGMVHVQEFRPGGELRKHIRDEELSSLINGAEIVLGVDHATGNTLGLYWGETKALRIEGDHAAGRKTHEISKVLKVPLDPDTDDPDVLTKMIEQIKGVPGKG